MKDVSACWIFFMFFFSFYDLLPVGTFFISNAARVCPRLFERRGKSGDLRFFTAARRLWKNSVSFLRRSRIRETIRLDPVSKRMPVFARYPYPNDRNKGRDLRRANGSNGQDAVVQQLRHGSGLLSEKLRLFCHVKALKSIVGWNKWFCIIF